MFKLKRWPALNFWRVLVKLSLIASLFIVTGVARSADSALDFSPLTSKTKTKLFLILIDKLTWQDITSAQAKLPTLKRLIKNGATGLLSNHTALSRTTTARSYITISAGNRATAGLGASLALTKGEKLKEVVAEQMYQQRYGQLPGKAQVFHLAIPAQLRSNELLNYGAQPALLGEVLTSNGLVTAVYGNADFDAKEQLNREAALIAADQKGRVLVGDTSRRNYLKLPAAPFGLATNYRYILQQLKQNAHKADFVVIETGDFRRVDAFKKYSSDEVAQKQTVAALKRLDNFLQSLLKIAPLSSSTYLLVSPSPPLTAELQKVQQLTPIIMVGKGIKQGHLTSSSTKRDGLVTSPDIAPTVLAFFGLPTPYQMTGRPMIVVPPKFTLQQLELMNEDYMLADAVASPSIITYIIWQSLALLLALVVAVSRLQREIFWRRLSQVWLLSALALPLAYLMAPLLPYHSVGGYVGAVLFFTVALLALAFSLERVVTAGSLLALAGTTVLFIVGNLLAGSYTDLRSVFGYSPIVAGRFYGMGNQTFSLLIPAFFVLLALLFDKFNFAPKSIKKPLVLVLFLLLIFLIGYPALGANTGGLITAVPAFAIAFLLFFYEQIKVWQIFLVFLAGILFLGLFVLADVYLLPTPTHMGKTALMVAQGGLDQLGIVIKRKALANFRIFKYTSWSYLIVTVMGLLFWQWLTQVNFGQLNFFQRHRYLKKSLGVVFTAGLIGMLVNDSGISIPALMLGYFLSAVFYLMLEELKRE